MNTFVVRHLSPRKLLFASLEYNLCAFLNLFVDSNDRWRRRRGFFSRGRDTIHFVFSRDQTNLDNPVAFYYDGRCVASFRANGRPSVAAIRSQHANCKETRCVLRHEKVLLFTCFIFLFLHIRAVKGK